MRSASGSAFGLTQFISFQMQSSGCRMGAPGSMSPTALLSPVLGMGTCHMLLSLWRDDCPPWGTAQADSGVLPCKWLHGWG